MRTRGALLAGVAAAIGLLPAVGRAQGAGPPESCAALAPMREPGWGEGWEPERMARELFEFRAEEGDGGVHAGGVRLRRPSGWLGLRTMDVLQLRWTPVGRVIRYCAYPVVVSVEPGSPAHRAGIAPGDTLVAYDGRDLVRAGPIALDELLVPGETLRVRVRRDGRIAERTVRVGSLRDVTMLRLRSMPDVQVYVRGDAEGPDRAPRPRIARAAPEPPLPPAPPRPSPARAPLPPVPYAFAVAGPSVVAGAQVVPMDGDLREAVRSRGGGGVLVVRVLPGTPAAEAGLRSGDVIVEAGGEAVTSPGALHRALMRGVEERAMALRVERRGKPKAVTIRW